MCKTPRQAFTLEFKALAVQRASGGRSIHAVARELGLHDQTLRNWIKAAARGTLAGSTETVTPAEMELSRMRAELTRLQRQNAILKKAAHYFLQEVL